MLDDTEREVQSMCDAYGVSRDRLTDLMKSALDAMDRYHCSFDVAMRLIAFQLVESAGARIEDVFPSDGIQATE